MCLREPPIANSYGKIEINVEKIRIKFKASDSGNMGYKNDALPIANSYGKIEINVEKIRIKFKAYDSGNMGYKK
jgi:hypothetical protein